VEAASDLLATLDSPQALTLRMVARRVGVAPASVYSHFTDLHGLVDQVLRLRYQELSAHLHDAAAHAATPVEDLVARCAAYLSWGITHPGHYRVVFGGRTPPEASTAPAHGAGAELLVGVVAALAAATPRRRRDDDPDAHRRAGLLLWAGLHGLVMLHIDRHNAPWPPLDDLLIELVAVHTGQTRPAVTTALQRVAPQR
jgi:AcrR family transcriptional regulator